MHSVISFFKKHPVLLLVLVVFVTAITAYHKYIFEGWAFLFDDTGSDTKQLYFMQYNSIVNHLRSGDFTFWDSTNGFGTSMFQYTLFNPLLWIIYLIGLIFGNAAMAGSLVWIVILAMILSGIAAWHFLSCFGFDVKAKFIAAYIYSFNGFLTVWGQHFAFLTIMIYLPFVLMLLELAMQKRKFSPALALCIGLTALCTYYLTYMLIIVVAVYAVLRLWTMRTGNAKTYFCVLFKQAGAVILGVGIGMINILTNIGIVFGVSSRTESTAGIFERIIQNISPWHKAYYETLADRFLSSSLQGNSSAQVYTGYLNYYEAPCVFFTSLLIILLVQFVIFLMLRKWDVRKKVASLIGIAMGMFALLVPAGSLPFNFFAYAFSRHTFLLMPFFALLTAFMMDRIIKERFLNIPGLIIVVLGCAFVCYRAYTRAFVLTVALNAVGICVLTIALGVFLVLYCKTSGRPAAVCYVLIFLTIVGQVWIDLYSTVYGREVVRTDDEAYSELYCDEYDEISKWLEENDDGEYRVESEFHSFSCCMDNLALGFNGVSTYNSTMDSDLLDFVEKLVPDMRYADKNHISFTQISSYRQLHDLFGIKYIISKNNEPPYEDYELVKKFGDFYLYKNMNWNGLASFYTDTASQSEYENLVGTGEKIDIAALLSQVLILDDDNAEEDSGIDLERYKKTRTDKYIINDDAVSANVTVNDGLYEWNGTDKIFLPLNNMVDDTDGTVSVSFKTNSIVYVSTAEQGDEHFAMKTGDTQYTEINLNLLPGTEGIYLRTINTEYNGSVYDFEFYTSEDTKHSQNAVINMKDTGNDGSYCANVKSDEDGYLLMPIPYGDGWRVTIDGTETKDIVADYGFSAVRLTAGEHTVEYRYTQPYLYEGLAATCVSLGIWAVIVCAQRRRRYS